MFVDNDFSVQNVINGLITNTSVCLDRSNIPDEELHWLYMPNDPSELATSVSYGYLSGQLITTGAVDASDCPLNGLWENGYANSCGLGKTREASLYLQNVYDNEILAAGRDLGVPPVMIKQLIRYESQFWPVQMGIYHHGLGHLTYIGASNALMWSPELFDDVCKSTFDHSCEGSYANQSSGIKAVLAGNLLSLLDATCPTCTYKIDIPKAEQSITYIAKALLGYCHQTAQVVYNATEKSPDKVVDYATIWKLTLFNYNMGPTCVYNAVRKSYNPGDDKKISWGSIAGKVTGSSCYQGVTYVENITGAFYDFNTTP